MNRKNEIHDETPAESEIVEDSETFVEENTADESVNRDVQQEENVIYKKEKNPFIKIGLWLVGSITVYCVVLFAVGFIIGLNGLRPPTVDPDAIQNQWYKITGEQPPADHSSELDKK